MSDSAEAVTPPVPGGVKTVVDPAYSVQLLPTNQIHPSRHQVRKEFSEDSIKALAASIKEEGLLEPIIVRKLSYSLPPSVGEGQDGGKTNVPPPPVSALPSCDHFLADRSAVPGSVAESSPMEGVGSISSQCYELIAGERRLRACKLLNWGTIPARVISTISEGEAAAKGLVENLQREDLNPIEEAQGFKELNQIDSHWTQEQIAKVIGRTSGYISQSFALLALPETVKEKFRRLNFSRSHGLELTRLKDPLHQQGIANLIVEKDLSVKETRKLVDEALGKKPSPGLRPPSPDTGRGVGGEGKDDPLADLWTELKADPLLKHTIQWKVHHLGGYQWSFDADVSKETHDLVWGKPEDELVSPQKAITDWFGAISRALESMQSSTEDEGVKEGA